jgi:transposase
MKERLMAAVMIGIDPHKASHTAVAIGAAEEPLGRLRVRASAVQAQRLMEWAADWPERTWAVEGAGGLGHLLAQQLVAAGERVPGVQPKLGARVRLLAAGDTNKNDPNDARSVAIAALRSASRREVAADDHAAVLKIWSKRHRDLGRARTQVACRLRAVLCELVPGGISKEITAAHAAHVRQAATPSEEVARAHHELAAMFLEDLRRLDAQLRDTRKKLETAVRASGTTTTEIFGVGPVIAATVTGCVGDDVSRFVSRDRFAAYNGADRGVLGEPQGPPAVPPREPAPQPRHPHGRSHPDPPLSQRRPGLLRPQDRRGQDPQRSAPVPQAQSQRRHLRPPPGRRQAHGSIGRARDPGGQPGNDSVASAAGSHPEHRLFGQATPGSDSSLRRPHHAPPPNPARTEAERPLDNKEASIWSGGLAPERLFSAAPSRT